MLTTLHAAAAIALLTPSCSFQTEPDSVAERIPVLVVSGANNHDWRWTTPSLVEILEEADLFEVTVTTEPSKDLSDAKALAQYGAVVLDYNGERWGEEAEATFIEAVEGGLGVVVVHAADNHGPGWVEYEKLVGDLWRKGTGHGRFHTFDVEMTDRDHPITRSLPDFVLHPDELYHRLKNVHGVERRVLGTAMSDPETGGTGNAEPMLVVKNYGQGRVFHTPLGHAWVNNPVQQASHRDPQFRGLITRGTEWAATGTVRDERTAPAPLTEEEQADGWVSLMNREAWQRFGGGEVPAGWTFDGETLLRSAEAGDITTRDLFTNFELTFDWKGSIAGNSGLKYRIPEGSPQPIGPEFQLLDAWAEAASDEARMGALYDVVAAKEAPFTPWGEYRSVRILVREHSIEHYIDDVLVASADTSSDEWQAAVKNSKFAEVAGFAQPQPGHLLLQDHGGDIWIRSMRIRPIEAALRLPNVPEDGWQPLISEGDDLGAWSHYGDAVYRTEGTTLIGSEGPQRKQSFLISEELFGDFELEVEVELVREGNSGIQFRSNMLKNGRFGGYQAEIDPSDRSWSAGIFDEGRRAWINDLTENDAARAAFKKKGRNLYRIVAEGPHLQTWLNGVPAADLLDAADLTGHFGFQVHGGDDDIELHWHQPRIIRKGLHAWHPSTASSTRENAMDLESSPAIRVNVLGDDAQAILHFADGTQSPPISLKDSKYLHSEGRNVITTITTKTRTVVQMNDHTIHDTPTGPAQAIQFQAAKELSSHQRCTKTQ
jgi:type 1 glutamine amidotransferase